MSGNWIFLVFVCVVCWGLMVFLPKLATAHIAPLSAIIYEVVGGVTVALVALMVLGFKPEFNIKGAALSYAVGLCGFIGTLAYFYAVSKGPVTIVSTLSALYPIISVGLGITLLHEPVTLRQIAGMVLAMGSVVLLAF